MRQGWRLALVLVLVSTGAYAQEEAAASALFDRGLSEMKAGRYDTGCPALVESYRLDPRTGTLFTVAECEAKWGHIATAVTHYEDYLERFRKMAPDQQRGQRGREKIAEAQMAALRPDIPTLVIELPKDAPKDVKVTRDGVAIGRASLGIALPIDPGEHVLAVSLQDGAAHEQKVTLSRGEKKTLVLELPAPPIVTPRVPDQPPTASPRVEPEGAKHVEPPPVDEPKSGSHVGWSVATLGLGVAGAAVGAVTGALTIGKKTEIDGHCRDVVCDAIGKAAADDARTLGAVSTTFIVGAVAVAGSVVLFLTEPKHNHARAALAIGPTGGGVSWSW
jgi:hypothetical protein